MPTSKNNKMLFELTFELPLAGAILFSRKLTETHLDNYEYYQVLEN